MVKVKFTLVGGISLTIEIDGTVDHWQKRYQEFLMDKKKKLWNLNNEDGTQKHIIPKDKILFIQLDEVKNG